MSFRRGTPWVCRMVLGILAVLSGAAMIPLALLARPAGSLALGNLAIAAVIGVPCAAVGWLVARRQPGNPLGWLFLVIAVCLFLSTDGGEYAAFSYLLGHHLPFGPAGLVLDDIWGPTLVLFALVILLFPDGRLPSARWRWALRAYVVVFTAYLAATAVAMAGALAEHPIRVDSAGGLAAVDHPSGWFNAVQGPIGVIVTGLSLAFIARQALSWRRAAGERRQQLKWLACGATISGVSVFLGSSFGVGWFGVAALPISMGVAILRYRLYEIDRIVSRTLAYAIVTGLLVGVYAGLVLLATHVLSVHSTVAVAAATLAAAALFNPSRRRVQHVVDRRFNRARYDADRIVAAFASRLKDEVDLDSIRDDLAGAVQRALEPAHVSVWINEQSHELQLPNQGRDGIMN
jgi:hypothetical protein